MRLHPAVRSEREPHLCDALTQCTSTHLPRDWILGLSAGFVSFAFLAINTTIMKESLQHDEAINTIDACIVLVVPEEGRHLTVVLKELGVVDVVLYWMSSVPSSFLTLASPIPCREVFPPQTTFPPHRSKQRRMATNGPAANYRC